MPLDLPKYVVPRNNKKRAPRYYFQLPRHMRPENWPATIRLSDDVGEMFRQAAGLLQRMQAERRGETPVKNNKGTFPWLLEQYHKTERYRSLSPNTQVLYDYCAKFISEWFAAAGNPHIKTMTRPLAFKFLDHYNSKPTKKKKIYVFLRVILGYAVDLGEIENNPALAMRVKEPEAHVYIWKEDEIDKIILTADRLGMSSVGTAILLGAETGQRQGDILRLRYGDHYKDGYFTFRQNKTKAMVSFPATEKLKHRLTGQEGFLVKSKDDKPYRRDIFGRQYNKVRSEAGLEHCIFMQLRHTALTNLARAGCSSIEIGAISGHSQNSVNAMLDKYVMKDTIMANNAMKKLQIKRKTDALSD